MNRNRKKTMILVEGDHEKSYLLKLMFKVFPEIPILFENIYIYETNIYDLYYLIEKEYGEKWDKDNQEIDLAYLYSIHKHIEPPLDGREFNNILILFDYERQDLFFTEDKIKRLQKHFNQTGDDGVLYINYPMIEAYLDFETIPDSKYLEKKVSVATITTKGAYKKQVNQKSVLLKYLTFSERTYNELKKLGLSDTESETVLDSILSLESQESLINDIKTILSDNGVNSVDIERVSKNLYYAIIRMDYLKMGSFYHVMRGYFLSISEQMIRKGYQIQTQNPPDGQLKSLYEELKFDEILNYQNEASRGHNGFIWILATCMTILGEYKFFWLQQ